MAVPKEMIWDCAPHTRAKHIILRRYLQAWFPILGAKHPKVIYVDGFAGPGIYSGGEQGSPLIALNAARDHAAKLCNVQIDFLFVENEPKRAACLAELISKEPLPGNFSMAALQGEFHTVLKRTLDDLDSSRAKNAPVFAFIDPFGFSGVPYELLKRLLSRDRTEVLVFFARNSINRFLETPSVANHMQELFGLEKIDIPRGTDRLEELKFFYEKRLKETARFVGVFTMLDEKGIPIYDLFFATNNALGYVKMKEAMWAVDATGAFRFSDKEDPNQMALFAPDPIPPLIRLLTRGGNHRKDVSLDKIEVYVNEKTIYLAKHMRAALRQMEEAGIINAQPIKDDGEKRRGKSFAVGTIIDFV